MSTTTASIYIEAPPAKIMAMLVAHHRYPELFAHIREVNVLVDEGSAWEVAYLTHVIRDLRYTLRLTREHDHRLSWTQLDGVFLRNEGEWRLSPDGDGTRVDYTLDIELAVFLPHAIARSLAERTLPSMLSQVKLAAESGTSSEL